MPLISPAILLLLAAPGVAGRLAVSPVGDGGSVVVRAVNRSVHPARVTLGAVNAQGLTQAVDGHATARFIVQCMDGAAGPAPRLEARVNGDGASSIDPVEVPPLGFSEGPPALWLSGSGAGRASLAALVAGAGGPALRRVSPSEAPTTFAALRFSPLILIGGATLVALGEDARRALRDAAAAGATVVIAAGGGADIADALGALTPVEVGEVEIPGPALRAALPEAVGRRMLRVRPGAAARVVAGGAPVVVEAPLALGRVRVLATRFSDLRPGPVADAALGVPPDALGALLAWLDQQRPLRATRASPLGVAVWGALVALALLGLLARRWPRAAALLAVPWWIAAVWAPPVQEATRVDAARVMYLPFAGGALAVGALDLSFAAGGGRALAAGAGRASLEDAQPAGACLIDDGDAAAWVLRGDPGDRRRLRFFALVDAAPPPAIGAPATLPGGYGGPFSGAVIRPVDPGDVVLPLAHPPASPGGVEAWRLDRPVRAPLPVVEL